MKSYSTEEIRRWIKIGDHKRRKIGVVAVKRMENSHQEDTYQTDEQRNQKRREEGYLSDNYGLRI